jgi:hypothetical protein
MEAMRLSMANEASTCEAEEVREGGLESLCEDLREEASRALMRQEACARDATMLSSSVEWSRQDADELREGEFEVPFCDDLSDDASLPIADVLDKSDDELSLSSPSSPTVPH